MATPLPARNIFDGTALPVTSVMKSSMGSLRDYLATLLGTTGVTTDALTALGAAANGANTDITSLKQGALMASVIATATGTADVITATYTPVITALTNGLTLSVRATLANATTTPTFSPNGLTAAVIVKGAGSALAAGDIAGAGHWIELQYDATLSKWVLLNPATGVSGLAQAAADVRYGAPVQGLFKNLQCSTTGLSAVVTFSADELVVETAAHVYTTLRALALTASTGAASGVANSLDTGSWAFNTWYAQYVIWNGTTSAMLWSLSATAPTLPSGYTAFARVGWIRTQPATNYYPLSFKQYGRQVRYALAAASNVTALPIMASGVLGSPTTGVWSAVSVASYVPPTALKIEVNLTARDVIQCVVCAPNANYGAYNSVTNPPSGIAYGGAGNIAQSTPVSILLESTSVYYGSTGATSFINCYGWEDNL